MDKFAGFSAFSGAMKNMRFALFVGYVLLAATRWAIDSAFPPSLPAGETSALSLFAVCCVFMLLPSQSSKCIRPDGWFSGVSGVLLFGGAWVFVDGTGGGLPALTRTALFTLVPVGVVLIAAARDSGGTNFLGMLGAALAGVAGVCLVLPVDLERMLGRPLDTVLTLGSVAGLSVGSSLVYRAMREMSLREGALLALLPVLLFHVGSLVSGHHLSVPVAGDLPALAWQAAEVACLILLLRGVEPVPLAARFLLVPLAGAVEGFVVVRPGLTWRVVWGTALLVFGSVGLLRGGAGARQDSSLSLL